MPVKTVIQIRRDTAANWTSVNPILAIGEQGYETDTKKTKVGDGATSWTSLPYFKANTAPDYETTVTASSATKSLDAMSPRNQFFTGTAVGQIVTLPDTATLTIGDEFVITNANASFTVSVRTSTSVVILSQGASMKARFTCISNADNTAAAWRYSIEGSVSATGSGALVFQTVPLLSGATLTSPALSLQNSSSTQAGRISYTGSTLKLGNGTSTVTFSDDSVTNAALALKAPLADPTFTGTTTTASLNVTGNLTVGGTTTTVNATNISVTDPLIYIAEGNNANVVDIGLVGSLNDGTYQHSGFARDATDGKWKLFKGVIDEPTTTINFAQGSLDALAVGSLEVGTVTNTEIGYLDGVTSAIQGQIDGKAATVHTHVISDTTGLQTALDGKSDTTHNHSLASLSDVSLGVNSNLDLLFYDEESGTWGSSNKTFLGIAAASHTHTFANITDVNVTSPTNGQSLTYDSASSKWINSAAAATGETISSFLLMGA